MSDFNPNSNQTYFELIKCDSGAVVTTELVLVCVAVLIGLIVGFSSVRDSVVSELTDTSLAVQNTNQSLTYNGTVGTSSTTAGSNWNDALDSNDGVDVAGSVVGTTFDGAPQNESDLEDFLESKDFGFEMTRGGFTWSGTADFDNGVFNGSPYWPGTYTISGDIITVIFDALGGGWDNGTMVLDASDPNNISGDITWVNSISGFVWEAMYRLFCL